MAAGRELTAGGGVAAARGVFARISIVGATLSALLPAIAHGQLRIATYNTATGGASFSQPFAPREADFRNVLDFIGRQEINGIAKPLDVLMLQEQTPIVAGQTNTDTTLQEFADLLNDITGTSDYVPWDETPPNVDGLQTGFVYNSATVSSIFEDSQNELGRSASFLQFRPSGYGPESDVFLVNHHFLAGSSVSDQVRRRDFALTLRFIGDNAPTPNVVYAGDFNQQSSFQDATNISPALLENPYSIFLDDTSGFFGGGNAIDPIASPGNWNNNLSFAGIHTQSPHDGSFGLTGGGMDDRFDFQLPTTELNDGEGVDVIGPVNPDTPGIETSYQAFGNNGSTFNSAANSSSNTALDWILTQGETLPGLTPVQTRNAVRDSVARASDHLPVVLDFQLPAVLGVAAEPVPPTLTVGQAFDLGVTVSNAADVIAALGADELDYTLTVSGDLSGGGAGVEAALGVGDLHLIAFDTATPGAKSGLITVSTTSQAAANALVELPISFNVLASLLGDVDLDGLVGASDIDLLYASLGSSDPLFDLDSDGDADLDDVATLVNDVLSTEFGDANLDGVIDQFDFSVLAGGFGDAGGWAEGDFDGSGGVDQTDFSILAGGFGFQAPAPVSGAPEPSSFLLGLCIAALRVASARRTTRSARVLTAV